MLDGSAEYPISNDLRDAFGDAAAKLEDWDRGGEEPIILLERRTYTVGAICDFVRAYSDRAPDEIYVFMCDLAKKFREEGLGHACEGPKDHSYTSVARCLLGLIMPE